MAYNRLYLLHPALIGFLLLFSKAAAAQFIRDDFEKFSALSGTWKMSRGKSFLFEVWERKNDTTLSARSFSVTGKDTIPEEAVQLSWHQGIITYTPTVARQNAGQPVTFTLKGINDSGFLFENPEHDFPQRIRYRRADNTLFASVSGRTAKGFREIRYRYSRVAETPIQADLGYFAGKWWLKAWTTAKKLATPDINANWQVETALQGASLTGQVRLLSGRVYTRELIAYNPAQREFTRTISAADSSYYVFTTKGWEGNQLTWIGTQSTRRGTVPMKQEIVRKGPDSFRAVFYIRDSEGWTQMMTEELERMPKE